MEGKLEQLRRNLASLDRKLLELVSEREKIASEIGNVKREAGLSPRDFRQERHVIARARTAAEELGISPQLAEEVLLLLIRSALTVQERDRLITTGGGTGKRALVVGGSGKMGRWFVSFLASQGFEVEVADPTPPGGELPRQQQWAAAGLSRHDKA